MQLNATRWGACGLLIGWPALVSAQTDLEQLAQAPAGEKIAYGSGQLQFGELSMPDGPGPHPVIINVHGGCWLAEYDIAHSRALAQALVKEGFAVWNIEYRRVGNKGGGWPATFQDVAAAADHVRILAKDRPLDLSRVIAMGHSVGGHFALWLAARHKLPEGSELFVKDPIKVVGVVGLAPAPMLDALHEKAVCGGVIDKLMGGGPETQAVRYAAAMPSRLAPIGVRQSLIIGEDDKAWRWVGESHAEKARAAGDGQIEVTLVPGAGHFEVIDPDAEAWKVVVGEARKAAEVK